jgi:hypothetical protein
MDIRGACVIALAFVAGCGDREPAAPQLPTVTTAALVSPAAAGSAEPHLAPADDGSAVLSWLEPDGDGVALRFAVLRDDRWQEARTVARGRDWFVNWADFPSVVPIRNDFWAAHWLVKRPGGTYAYDVAVALSSDAGASWRDPIVPHADGTPTEHGFVSLFPAPGGVGAVWLDGRNMADATEAAAHHDAHGTGGGMTLRAVELSADGEILDNALLDELVCDCCQTDAVIVGRDPLVVYRDRSPGEVRDIHLVRSVEGTWQTAAPVHEDGWEIAGCPVNGPAVAAAGKNVAVAWFTAADDKPRVRAAYSPDGGINFGPAIDVDAALPIGRVDIEMLGGATFVVSWLARDDQSAGWLVARAVGFDGMLHPPYVVAATATGRSAGVPQMVRRGEHLVFAWTAGTGPDGGVATARVAVRELTARPAQPR